MFKKIINNNLFKLIILSAIWGSAFIGIKISVASISPISIVFLRLVIASFILLIFFLIKRYNFNFSFKVYIYIFFIALFGNFLPFYLISWSEIYIQSNTAGLLLSVAPIFALILSHFMTKDDKFSFLKLTSILIGLLGVLLIIGFDPLSKFYLSSSKNLIPKIAIIISALGYVISSILAYNLKNIDSVTLTTAVTISAAIISIPFLFFIELNFHSRFSFSNIFPLIYLGIFPTAIAFVIRFYIISKAGPIFLSYVAYLIPAFAIIWGFLFLKETINLSTLIGVILVLLGVFISQKNLINKEPNQSISN